MRENLINNPVKVDIQNTKIMFRDYIFTIIAILCFLALVILWCSSTYQYLKNKRTIAKEKRIADYLVLLEEIRKAQTAAAYNFHYTRAVVRYLEKKHSEQFVFDFPPGTLVALIHTLRQFDFNTLNLIDEYQYEQIVQEIIKQG